MRKIDFFRPEITKNYSTMSLKLIAWPGIVFFGKGKPPSLSLNNF
ncbi:hypothetical protein [Syntrophomonas wolfei]|nr:hypothetical protein [Syntrophomonas wolfei]